MSALASAQLKPSYMADIHPPSVEQTAFMALELERQDLVEGIRAAILAGASPEMIAERLKNNSAKPALVQLALLAARYIRDGGR